MEKKQERISISSKCGYCGKEWVPQIDEPFYFVSRMECRSEDGTVPSSSTYLCSCECLELWSRDIRKAQEPKISLEDLLMKGLKSAAQQLEAMPGVKGAIIVLRDVVIEEPETEAGDE